MTAPHRKTMTARGIAATMLSGLLLCGLSSGCKQLDLANNFTWPGPKEPDYAVPDHMTDMWSHTVLQQGGLKGVRGFGGRLMFFDKTSNRPIRVDGQLTVLAFDANNDDPEQVMPEKKYVFSAERLQEHFSESKLGPSYSFWLPWGEIGGPPRHITLITLFNSTEGQLLTSDPSRHKLAGMEPTPSTEAPATAADGTTRPPHDASKAATRSGQYERALQVSYDAPLQRAATQTTAPAVPRKTMQTTTISLTPTFTQHISGGGQADGGDQTDRGGHRETMTYDATALPSRSPYPWELRAAQAVREAYQTRGYRARGYQADVVEAPQPRAAASSHPDAPRTSQRRWTPPARSAPQRYQARRAAVSVPRPDPVRRQPHHVTWPSALPPTPRSAVSAEWPQSPTAGVPVPDQPLPPMVYYN